MATLTETQRETLRKMPLTVSAALIDRRRDQTLQSLFKRQMAEPVRIDALRTRWKTTKLGRVAAGIK